LSARGPEEFNINAEQVDDDVQTSIRST